MSLQNIRQIKNLVGKTVLVRVDFNVPLKSGQVTEDYKIEKTLPTIRQLILRGAKVILVSHLGRPEGVDRKLSLKPVVKSLETLLNKKVHFVKLQKPERYFLDVLQEKNKMHAGDVVLLENIRFFSGEESGDINFSKQLAALADYFVSECFAVAHRDAASITGVPKYLPSYAGLLLEEEISGLTKILKHPKKPLVVILGGIKMETKLPILKKMLPLADKILLGGGMVNTYLWAKGYKVGTSVIDKEFKKEALQYCDREKVVAPLDLVVGRDSGQNAEIVLVERGMQVPDGCGIYDIGPRTISLYAKYIKNANTLVWNGAMGLFEVNAYKFGTHAIARLVAMRSKGKAFGVCGGGETVEVLKKLHIEKDVDLVSTGGGAMLEYLGGKELPGIRAIN